MPFGVRLRRPRSRYGADGRAPRRAWPAASSAGCSRDPWSLPLTHDAFRAVGSGLGCGSFALLGADDCPVDAAADAVAFLAAESARQCGVCINATAGMRDVLGGTPRRRDAAPTRSQRMAGWTEKVPGRGACALVDAAARMAASLLREFPPRSSPPRRPCPRCAALGPLPRHTRHHVDPHLREEPVMKLVLDQTACQGYGLCQEAAPDLVDLDDWGYAGLLGDGTVPATSRIARRRPSRCARSRP